MTTSTEVQRPPEPLLCRGGCGRTVEPPADACYECFTGEVDS